MPIAIRNPDSYANWLMKVRGETPYKKIRKIISRLSRERWLSPTEVRSLMDRLSGRYIYRAQPYTDHILGLGWNCVGILNGKPPFFGYRAPYGKLMAFVKRRKKPLPFEVELKILELTIRSKHDIRDHYY